MLPGLLVNIIKEGIWQRFVVDVTGEEVEFDSFEEFVTADLPDGMGTTVQRLKHLCRDEPVALDAIDRACRGKHGGDRRSEVVVDQASNRSLKTYGNSREYQLARLQRDHHNILADLNAGKYPSVRQAAIAAGIVRVPSQLDVLRREWRAATPEERAELQAKTIGQGTRTDTEPHANGTKLSRGSNGTEYLLRRLRDQRPDLHEQVLAGELSAHAAMVTAGFRKRATPIDRLWSAWRAATPDQRAEFLAGATR